MKKINLKVLTIITAVSIMFIAAKPVGKHTILHVAKKGKWISLFDGQSLKGWHTFNKTTEINNWKAEDGILVCMGLKTGGVGDIVTDQKFENFELELEWKIEQGSNTGIFYHVVESPKYKRPSETAPEYQIIDDLNFPAKLEEWQKTGADYAMYIPNSKKKLNPVGEWNSSRIIFKNNHVEYWLNGNKIVNFEAYAEEWEKKRKDGKWKEYPDYGISKSGSIGLQDYGKKAYFKNIRIRQL